MPVRLCSVFSVVWPFLKEYLLFAYWFICDALSNVEADREPQIGCNPAKPLPKYYC